MKESLLLNQSEKAFRSETASSPVRQLTAAITNATINVTGGLATLTLPGASIRLSPDTRQPTSLPQGRVLLARATDGTAIILDVLSQTSSSKQVNKDFNAALATTLLKQGTGSLPAVLSLPVTAGRANGAPVLHFSTTGISVAVPDTQRTEIPASGKYTLTINSKDTELAISINTQPPKTLSLTPQNEAKVIKAAIIHGLQSKGLMLSGAPEALIKLIKSEVPAQITSQIPLLIKSQNGRLSVQSQYLEPRAKIILPDSVLTRLPPIPATQTQSISSLPLLDSQVLRASEPFSPSHATTSKVTPTDTVQMLAKKLLIHTGSTNQALRQLFQILNQGELSADTQSVLSGITKYIAPASAETTSSGHVQPISRDQIIRMVQSAMQPLTPTVMQKPAIPASFSSALVTLVQLVLAGRSQNKSSAPLIAEQVSQQIIDATGTKLTPEGKRGVINDIANLEKQFGLLSPLKTLLANHQSGILTNIESRSQGLDQLYFCLPLRSDFMNRESEVLIKWENDQRETDDDSPSQRKWSLTMKLDVGDSGELLAKSKISASSVTLNLYASTPALLDRVVDTLPLLTDRLTQLGIEVLSASAQQGKIPDSLRKSPYQFFEVTV